MVSSDACVHLGTSLTLDACQVQSSGTVPTAALALGKDSPSYRGTTFLKQVADHLNNSFVLYSCPHFELVTPQNRGSMTSAHYLLLELVL